MITLTNPIDASISLYEGDYFNLRGTISDASGIKSINIYINESPYKIGLSGREFTIELGSELFNLGENTIKIEAVDMSFNIGTQEVRVQILER